MERFGQASNKFKWQDEEKEDIGWYSSDEVLCSIKPLMLLLIYRAYAISEDDYDHCVDA